MKKMKGMPKEMKAAAPAPAMPTIPHKKKKKKEPTVKDYMKGKK